ncbi:kelch domain-containing protein 8A-like [Styela clava]|uniref:kelch domain-containing protein 8A-like n=1 Tax=Styela clava TaxID=7725 RepID=UPI00193AD5AA|nr:kelch domain-containing protein 8A-like [Styela clava]
MIYRKNMAANFSWSSINPMCDPRVYSSAVSIDGKIYVVGGCDKMGQPVNTLEVYDPSSNEWTSLKHMPSKRAAPITVAISNKIVAIGGIGCDQLPVDAVEFYKIDENKWKRLQPLSEALMGMAHITKDGKIHIFGGMGSDTNPRDHFKCLDVESSSGNRERWQAFPPMPTARYASSAFLKNNKVYVVGGRQGKLPVSTFEVYDYDSRCWTAYPQMITKRLFPSYVMTDKYLISLGGLKETAQQGFSDACEIYSTEQQDKGEWFSTKKMNVPTKRGDFTAVAIDNKVFITGGLGNQGKPLASTEMFDPDSKKWKRLSDMPVAHSTCSSIVFQGALYVFGGISPEGPSGACAVFKS